MRCRPWTPCAARCSTWCCWTSACRAPTASRWPRPLPSCRSRRRWCSSRRIPNTRCKAFELEAVDYLTKPVRLERLQQALQKVERLAQAGKGLQPDSNEECLIIQDRGRTERVPLAEVLYLKAELKYITVRTPRQELHPRRQPQRTGRALPAVPARPPQCAGGAARRARARKALRSGRRRRLGGAAQRHRGTAGGVAAPAQRGARSHRGLRRAAAGTFSRRRPTRRRRLLLKSCTTINARGPPGPIRRKHRE